MKYEQIVKANESIKTTDIKGKDYAEVNQRIKAYRMVEPDGAIIPEIVKLENGVCVMKATILNSDGKVLAIGHAYEKEDSSFINKTSYIENCETSAVGRALGMCGFGIDTSIASYEEVANAIENQKPKAPKQEQTKVEVMTLEKAKEMTFEAKGKVYKVGECSNEQLFYLRDNAKNEELLDAVKLVLIDKAKTGNITDENHD
jgi:hypothetical protein